MNVAFLFLMEWVSYFVDTDNDGIKKTVLHLGFSESRWAWNALFFSGSTRNLPYFRIVDRGATLLCDLPTSNHGAVYGMIYFWSFGTEKVQHSLQIWTEPGSGCLENSMCYVMNLCRQSLKVGNSALSVKCNWPTFRLSCPEKGRNVGQSYILPTTLCYWLLSSCIYKVQHILLLIAILSAGSAPVSHSRKVYLQ